MGEAADEEIDWAYANEDAFEDGYEGYDDETPCPTCNGTGQVNALTNPDWAPFVASYGTCPSCDGDGTI